MILFDIFISKYQIRFVTFVECLEITNTVKQPKMTTDAEQQQMIEQSNTAAIQQLREENEHSDEYFNRKFHWKIDYTGTMNVPTRAHFHPNHFHGTEFQLDSIIVRYLRGREDEFKITGMHKFATVVEYREKFPIKTLKK